jgi:hypothetical protein
MKRRRLVRLLALLAVLAALTVWLEPTRVVWGWLRGEAFYQGRPTSYWAERIRPWQLPDDFRTNINMALSEWRHIPATREEVALYVSLAPRESDLRKSLKPWLRLPDIAWPAVLDGDAEAAPVLTELLHHNEPGIRDWARRGLERVDNGERGASVRIDGPVELRVAD